MAPNDGRVRYQQARVTEFYSPLLGDDLKALVARSGIGTSVSSTAKSILLHSKRLIELGDSMLQIKRERDALSLLWYMICAESISKLESKASVDAGSRRHAVRFFMRLVPFPERQTLQSSFVDANGRPVPPQSGLHALYTVRCALAHEGTYWGFKFGKRTAPSLIDADTRVYTTLTRDQFRHIVRAGAVNAAALRDRRDSHSGSA